MTVRLAEPSDAAAVRDLLGQLGYPDDNDVDSVRQRLENWAAEPAATALVAERDGQVVGVVAVAAMPCFERPGKTGRVVAIVTSDVVRGQGVGKELMAHAERIAKEYGCSKMEVTSSNWRTDAHAFYRGLGYDNWSDRAGRFMKEFASTGS
ncbi:GNAT family N-acetyltransferase [Kibdelosporangium philippinense]|uniref:GNAT family N-acetyltransferase n=1 Tax=Kibdelosporangium philippinense TaxID=211113 RepID=A0ABS8Z5B9_9PSEU|nr:GNAT family N-acetyltransferase [Kibdelosporangium philippinense]MCE7003020.1 GNAT family N-acetyltransferase [Kibdelosporangium philippinense]